MITSLHIVGGLEFDAGGPPVSILNVCAAAAKSGIRPVVLVPVHSLEDPATQEIAERVAGVGAAALPFTRLSFFKSRAARWGISPELVIWVLRHAAEFDVIVLHGAWLISSLAGLIAARLHGRPCIMFPHESLTRFDAAPGRNPFRRILKSAMKRIYGRYCRLIIFASQRERNDSVSQNWRADTTVIPHAIRDPEISPGNRVPSGPAGNLRLGFLGRFHEKKNLDQLLQILSGLPRNISLVIGGDGPPKLKNSLYQLSEKLGLGERVTWLGFVSPEAKNRFFKNIDILVMPSAYESFGLVAAEAIVRGVPAIVSPSTGIAEIISAYGGGVVAELRELHDIINMLSKHPKKLEDLSSEAFTTGRKAFSLSAFGERLKEEYIRLLPAQDRSLVA